MKLHGPLAPLCLIALAACSGDPADEAPGDTDTAAMEEEGASEDAPSPTGSEAAPDRAGGSADRPYDPDFAAPQSASVAEFAAAADRKLTGAEEWQPPAPTQITGKVGDIILDVPPYPYVMFGESPTDVTLIARMEPVFGREQHFARDGFTSTEGTATVSCVGKVVRTAEDIAPIYEGCFALFKN